MGAGGSVAEVSGPGGLPGDHRGAGRKGRGVRRVHVRRARPHRHAAEGGGHRRHGLRPDEAPLLHLPQNVHPEQEPGRCVRPVRLPGHCGHGGGLLQRAGHYPRPVQAHSGPVQGLHRHAEAQYVPEPAHHGGGRKRHSLRGADPDEGDARGGGVRRGRPLEVQAERPGRRRRAQL